MLARVTLKPTTDIYSGVSTSGLYGQELPLVRVQNPTNDTDPNTAGLSPSNARVLQWPNYGNVLTGIGVVSILGGTSVQGRFWIYDTASGKWLCIGALVTSTVGGAQGNFATSARSKRLYWQSTTVTGPVTDLFYGIV